MAGEAGGRATGSGRGAGGPSEAITRSMDATSAVAASYVARRRRAMPSGWWGAILLVATEASFFGTLITSYFYLRVKGTQWPPPGVPSPDMTAPLILAGVLVATSLPMLAAVRYARAGRTRAAWLALLAAVVIQAGYLALQIHFFASDLDKFKPDATAYGSIYYTLLAAHHLHVLVGILLVLWLLARLLSGLTNYRLIAVRVVAVYWYFVNALALLVLLTQISPRL
jgi:heme/copper-type cytochrome/quinol oxidase subunit 3